MNRNNNLHSLQTTPFDLLVIGGGVTGAGIALDAASRGLKTALVEKDDFASGTSSKSTKLVHGGLRYLKQLDIGLVHEVGRERAIVPRLAPHLVIPEQMLLPIIKGGTYGKLASNVGLRVYDLVAGVRKSDRRVMLSRQKALEAEPLLPSEPLKGAGLYYEYQTDDARLTIELIKTASRYGALCVNYCKLNDFLYRDDVICGGRCTDVMTGNELEIRATAVVNAAGPWVDEVRKINNSITKKKLHLTKGVHLVVDHQKLPLRQAVYFDVPDGRMIFAIPRWGKTYFGTTDTDYHSDKDHIVTTPEDAKYLLNAVNHFFKDVNLGLQDVESSWAGVRPLIHQEGKSASEISRRDEMFIAPDGLISIAGGKLTGYRVMAQKTVDEATKRIWGVKGKVKKLSCLTREIPLAVNPLGSDKEVDRYRNEVRLRGEKLGLSGVFDQYLVQNYGREADKILDAMIQTAGNHAGEKLIRAELRYGIENEMVMTAVDFFDRRTGRLSFDPVSVKQYKDIILKDLGTLFDWDRDRLLAESNRLDLIIKELTFV